MLWMNTTLISFTLGKSLAHRLPKIHTMSLLGLRKPLLVRFVFFHSFALRH